MHESTLNDISVLTFHWGSIFFLSLIENSKTIWLQNISKYPLASKWKVVKWFCFLCLFSKVQPLWNPSSSVIVMCCTYPEIEEVLKWCWQQELLLRAPVLCQIVSKEERGIAKNDIHTHNQMSICAHTWVFQNTPVWTDSLRRINIKNFLWVIS